MNNDDVISVVITTSPQKFHPETGMLDYVIDSLSYLSLSSMITIHIVYDYYTIVSDDSKAHSKRGRIHQYLADKYEAFKLNMTSKNFDTNMKYKLNHIILNEHHGFAMAVNIGLQACITDYCLVLQHDRAFINKVDCLYNIIELMKIHKNIRYIGMTTTSTVHHDRLIRNQYTSFESTYNEKIIHFIDDNGCYCILQPLLFMYDSNFLCEKNRFLELYKPYISLTALQDKILMQSIGNHRINEMKLRKGDFIEDRLGQQQRILLTSKALDIDISERSKLFDYFSTFLLYIDFQPDPMKLNYTKKSTSTLVAHLRGRQLSFIYPYQGVQNKNQILVETETVEVEKVEQEEDNIESNSIFHNF